MPDTVGVPEPAATSLSKFALPLRSIQVSEPAVASSSQSPLPAKAVSLYVRPFLASHLCFQTDGILGDLESLTLNPNVAAAWDAVTAFNFRLVPLQSSGSRPTLPATGSITFTDESRDQRHDRSERHYVDFRQCSREGISFSSERDT